MKILVIPSWHPIPERPSWAIWVLPYIDALRESGHDVYILQVNNDVAQKINQVENKVIYFIF